MRDARGSASRRAVRFVAPWAASACFAVAPSQADVGLQVSLNVDQGGGLVGPDETAIVGVNESVTFVLLAEMTGVAPAFVEFEADLVPFWPCGGEGVEVESFEFGDWVFEQTPPQFEAGAILNGSAMQVALPGVVDASNPLEIARFSLRFTDGPERLIYQVIPQLAGGGAFKVVEDSTVIFDPPVMFGPSVFESVRVIAVGSPGKGSACSTADLAEPYGVLDLADVQSFVQSFLIGMCGADLSSPWGVFDLSDVQAFAQAFIGGCR